MKKAAARTLQKGPEAEEAEFFGGRGVHETYMSPPKNDGDEGIGSFLKWAESFVQAVRERMAGHQEGPVDKETLVCADAFATVSRYEHPALLELLRVKALGGGVSALSRALGLPAARVREALERLQRLGFVTCEEGRWRRAEVGHVRVPDVPSQAIRDFHKSMLNKAWDAIDTVEPQARDCTGVVVATSLERLAGAKALVARFRRELRVYLEDCEPEVLYHFACQLFPVSEPA